MSRSDYTVHFRPVKWVVLSWIRDIFGSSELKTDPFVLRFRQVFRDACIYNCVEYLEAILFRLKSGFSRKRRIVCVLLRVCVSE
jgi:hypothetical protein